MAQRFVAPPNVEFIRRDCNKNNWIFRFSFTLSYNRCTAPNKGNDYQKIYSDWCHEFEKYKSAMKMWEKKQAVSWTCTLETAQKKVSHIFLIKTRFSRQSVAVHTCDSNPRLSVDVWSMHTVYTWIKRRGKFSIFSRANKKFAWLPRKRSTKNKLRKIIHYKQFSKRFMRDDKRRKVQEKKRKTFILELLWLINVYRRSNFQFKSPNKSSRKSQDSIESKNEKRKWESFQLLIDNWWNGTR